MKKRNVITQGSITVFLTLIFTVVLALICTVIESGRVYTAGVRAKSLTYMALESEFAGYSRQLFDDYGILMLWEKGSIEESLKKYIDANNSMADIDTKKSRFDMLNLQLNSIELENITYATDDGGDDFVKQVLEYGKYEMAGSAAEQLVNYYKSYNNPEAGEIMDSDATEDYEDIDSEAGEQDGIVEEFEEGVADVKENEIEKKYKDIEKKVEKVFSKVEDNALKDSQCKKIIKYFKKLEKRLSSLNEDVEEVIKISDEYKELNDKVVNEYGKDNASNGKKGYIEDNTDILKKIQNSINRVRTELLSVAIEEMESGDLTDKEAIENVYWNPVSEEMEQIFNEQKSLYKREVSEEEKKGKSIFETAKDLLDTGIVELVTPKDFEISEAAISTENLPSKKCEESRENELDNLLNKAVFIQYADNHFGNSSAPMEDHCLQYEMEYIIAGKSGDKANLSDTAVQIVGMRQVLNTAYILTDEKIMSTCTSVATAASTAIGLPFITPIVKVILMQAWALAESVVDVRNLLEGEGVPLIKNKDDWNTSLTNLADSMTESSGKTKNKSKKASENNTKGAGEKLFKYDTYLMILLMTKSNEKIIYRTMDLIQLNVNKQYNSAFRMNKCITSAKVNAKYGTEGLFTSLPFVRSIINSDGESYEFEIDAKYEYIN